MRTLQFCCIMTQNLSILSFTVFTSKHYLLLKGIIDSLNINKRQRKHFIRGITNESNLNINLAGGVWPALRASGSGFIAPLTSSFREELHICWCQTALKYSTMTGWMLALSFGQHMNPSSRQGVFPATRAAAGAAEDKYGTLTARDRDICG